MKIRKDALNRIQMYKGLKAPVAT